MAGGASRAGGEWSRPRSALARSGVRLRLDPALDFAEACTQLERELRVLPPVSGLAVTLETPRPLTAPDLRRLEELFLDRFGAQLLQVVEAEAAAPPAAGGDAPGARAADRAEAVAPSAAGGAGADGAARPASGDVPLEAARVRRTAAGGAAGRRSRPGGRRVAPPSVAAPAPERAVLRPDGGARSGPAVEADPVPTMLVKRTLRSGQRVRFPGNVVVLGDVNPGAEIVAAGDIVVMGTLRGVAHAGATGGEGAVITAFRLHPTQIRVGSVIGRAPDGRVPRPDGPEVARVRDGVLVVERYVPQ